MLEKLQNNSVCILGFDDEEANNYGRLVISDEGNLDKIVEFKDANETERKIALCNSGVIGVDGEILPHLLSQIKNDNVAGEYYLTDIVAIANMQGHKCTFIKTNKNEVLGVNSRVELANLEKIKLALRFPKDDNPILNIIANSTSPLFANIDCIEKIQEKLQDSESESIPTLKFSVIAFGILSSREFDNVDILTQKIDLIIKHKEAIKIICKHSQGPNLSVLDVANFIYGFDSEEVDKTLSDFYQAFENKTFFRNKACLVFNNKRLKLSYSRALYRLIFFKSICGPCCTVRRANLGHF